MIEQQLSTDLEVVFSFDIDKPQLRAFFVGRLPLPPGINASYKRITIKRRDQEPLHTLGATEALHQFKDSAALLLSQGYHDWPVINAIRDSSTKKPVPTYTPLRMDLNFFFPSLWKRDEDGGVKAVQDAVFHRLELDDKLVVDLHVTKRLAKPDEEPRCEVEVYCVLLPPSSH